MSILKYLNKKYGTTTPTALGDRYYAQDLVRDWRYAQDNVGQLAYDFIASLPIIMSGGIVTQGAGDTLNITSGRGWAKFAVEIPDTFASIPPSKMNADVTGVPVIWTAQTNLAIASATLDGSTPNYVKVAFIETDGNTRVRAKATGTYSYETIPSYVITVDSTPATDYEILLNTFAGSAGGTFTFTGVTSNLYQKSPEDGWREVREQWTYASADSPTFTLTVPTDKTSKYSKGMRLRLEQDEALTSYWSFDSDLTDGVGSNDGTAIGGAAVGAGGKFGNGLTLNGSSQAVSITDDVSLKPTGDFVIFGWGKTSYSGGNQQIFQSQSTNTSVAGIQLFIQSMTGYLVFKSGDNTGVSGYDDIIGKTDVTDGIFHYIVVTVKNNWCQIYLDGKLDVSGYVRTPAYAGTNYVNIGCKNSAGSGFDWFNGTLDDIGLVNGYAWDEETIKAKYDAGTAQGTGAVTIQKKFLITDVAYDGSTNTTLTLYGGTDFALSNSAIANPYFSIVQQPYGFNRNPDKWSIYKESNVLLSVALTTGAYVSSTFSVNKPIGKFNLHYALGVIHPAAAETEIVAGYTNSTYDIIESINYVGSAVGHMSLCSCRIPEESKKTVYINVSGATGNTMYFKGDIARSRLRLTSDYI